jgi:hypothetical protein
MTDEIISYGFFGAQPPRDPNEIILIEQPEPEPDETDPTPDEKETTK